MSGLRSEQTAAARTGPETHTHTHMEEHAARRAPKNPRRLSVISPEPW